MTNGYGPYGKGYGYAAGGLPGEAAPPLDGTPDAFAFTDVTDADPSTVYVSNAIEVAGLGSGVSVAVSITGGEYRKNGGSWVSSADTAENGDDFEVRHTSSASNSTATNTTLTIGGVSDTFTTTTEASGGGDGTPAAFSFTDLTDRTPSTLYVSNAIEVAGIDISVAVSITGGEYRKNGGSWTSSAGTAVVGDDFEVRHTSSASFATATNTVLTIGGVSDTFTTTTIADPVSPALMWDAGQSGDYFSDDITAMFTTAAGMTNVATDGTAVELIYNKALMGGLTASAFVAAAANLIVNGTFTTDLSSWTGGTWSQSSGKALHAAGSNVSLTQARATADNSLYLVSVTTSGRTAGNLKVTFSGGGANATTATWATNAVNTVLLESNGNTSFELAPSTTFDGSADDVTLKLICKGHGVQTGSLRPLFYDEGYREYNGSTQYMPSVESRCGASGNTIWARAIWPASVPARMFPKGLQTSAGSGAFAIGIDTDGLPVLLCGAGEHKGITDIRGLPGVLAGRENGTNIDVYWCEERKDPIFQCTAARNGAPSTAQNCFEGALNSGGSASSFFGAMIAASGLIGKAASDAEMANLLRYHNLG